jgi:hypothetical protein
VAGTLGDLIQVVDNQSYLGQQVLNVYYYRITSVTPLLDPYMGAMSEWFDANVVAAVRELQVNTLLHVSREWRNLSNGTDLFTETTVIPGDQATSDATSTPSYVSAGFMLQRESLLTRNGYKRFAGIPEGSISGNTYTEGSTFIDAVEAALAADIVVGIATIAEPVIVKRPIEVPVGEYVYSSIGSAQFRSLGTQNTRKAGRGV